MIDTAPKLANVALNAIGSVTDGLIELATTGKANFKEMAASILKDLAKIMLKAAIAQTIAGVFGINLNADGNVIENGRVKPYAKGGVVGEPTFFPMAGRNVGLMGEAGPEAIMPLKRGSDGRLGVEASGQGAVRQAAMSRYSRSSGNSAAALMSGGQEAEGDGSASNAVLDVNYSVERINNINYVTAAEFEKGMAQAAKRGAEMGKRGVYSDLVNKRSIRSRVGI